jgi:hypothetical protein
MFRRTFMAVLAAAVFATAPSASPAAEPKSLEIFGARLNGATRDQLRQVLKKQGLPVLKEDKNEWFDTYRADAALEGATELVVGYVQADTFAIAEYTLPSFMDIQQVQRKRPANPS